MDAIFYEDVVLKHKFISSAHTLDAQAIIAFAQQWDPQPYHTDEKAAKDYPLGQLFASGVHLIALCSKLANESSPNTQALAGMGWDKLRFKHPCFVGDSLRCENWAIEKRLSKSRPDAGIVTYQLELINQRDECILSYTVTCLMQRKKRAQ